MSQQLKKQKTRNPKVSVLIPVKNGEQFLKQCLESLINQTFNDFEIILVDNNCTDSSNVIAKKYVKKLNLKIITCSKDGVGPALNRGLKKCRGEYICRLDSDDIAHPSRLEFQVNYLQKNKSISILSSDSYLLNKKGQVIGNKTTFSSNWIIKFLLNFYNPISHPSCLIVKKDLCQVGGYSSSNKIVDDYDLWLRFKNSKYKFHNQNKYLVYYRIHEKSETTKNKNTFLQRILRTREKAFKNGNISYPLWMIGNIILKIIFFLK